jgi:hypothetical protein
MALYQLHRFVALKINFNLNGRLKNVGIRVQPRIEKPEKITKTSLKTESISRD